MPSQAGCMDTESSMQDEVSRMADRVQVLLINMRTKRCGPSIDVVKQLRSLDRLLIETSSVVRSYMNLAAPINRLPAEVLSIVFGMASLTPFGPAFPRCPVGWYQSHRILHTQLMRVCQLWRDVGNSTASLWSDITLRPCQTLPLPVQLSTLGTTSINEGNVRPLVPVLSEHSHRIRVLHIRGIEGPRGKAQVNEVLTLLPKMALHIEELVLHAGSNVVWPDGGPTPTNRTASIFSGLAPRLQVLSLYVTTLVPTDQFPNLRALYLTIENSVHQTDLLAMLRGSPVLKNVYIYIFPILMLSPNVPDGCIVRLPHLRTLTLSLGRNTRRFLSDLVLPHNCLVRLQNLALSKVPLCLATLEKQLDAGELTKLSLNREHDLDDANHDDRLYVTLCNTAADSGLQLGINSIHGHSRDCQAFVDIFCPAFEGCPLYANIKELSIFTPRGLVDSPLLNSLRSLTTINHIFVDDPLPRKHSTRTQKRMWDAPRVLVLAQASRGGAVTCPTLNTLYLIGWGIDELEDARNIVAFVDKPGYEEWIADVPKGGWRSHSARARYQWPCWPEF